MKLPAVFVRNQSTLLYGGSLALLLIFLKWLEIRLIIIDHAFEMYIGIIAILFTGLGIWLALKLSRPKTVIVEKQVFLNPSPDFCVNDKQLKNLNISKRELEVLQLIATGLSNQEIAERLFVSLNTIKTHSSKLFEKLNVKSRIQAVEQGRQAGLLP